MEKLGSECPDPECVKQTKEEDSIFIATTKAIVPDVAVLCESCHKIFILKSKLKDSDLEKVNKCVQARNVPIVEHEILPIGLNPRNDLMQAVIFFTDEIVTFALMESICTTLSDKIAATPEVINKAAVKIYGRSDAVEIDKLLCFQIAKNFDLEQTGLEHSEYEANRWKQVGTLSRFQRYLRYLTDQPNQALSDYMVAWGIYYARKFHDIAIAIHDSFKADMAHADIAKQCNEICAQYTEAQQHEYYQFILEKSREEAIKKYILEYTKPETSTAAVENKQTKSNRGKFGKAQLPS